MDDQDKQSPMLEYGHPDRSKQSLFVEAISGAIVTCIVCIVAIVVLILIGSENTAVRNRFRRNSSCLAIVIVAVKLTASPRYHGWGMGIWIGLGLTVLIEGTCFIIASH